ncbi:DoxX family protein [Mycolicibacterium smegmatis]|uniref:DoxX family protein n=1 Tax=Mycolicibacterium smegmatis TaxID=1772 RepID=UPI0013036B16|nr:DoxX family protein [Mycolicibacterium smegmatis]
MTSSSQDPWQRPDNPGTGDSARPAGASLVDPEDDLPSASYGGDFETTAIPRYDSKAPDQSAFSMVSEPEPLPYVQPGLHAPMGAYPAEPVEIDRNDVVDDQVRAAGRRGTQDLGLLILRVAIGGLLILHGLQKAFGWWGGPGFDGFGTSLDDMGFKYSGILTYVATGGQIAAGVLLVLGLFTPIAAAGALAYGINGLLAEAMIAHEQARLSEFFHDGHQYRLVILAATAAVILTGPGRYGFDAGRGWARRPFVGSFVALLIGIGAGIGIWALLNGGNPLG